MPALPLSQEQLDDAARLKAIYVAKKRNLGLTQDSLAAACGWESQGSVSQYLNGKIPLNVEAAVKFARNLVVAVSDFSPTLAAELSALRDSNHATPPKPDDISLSSNRLKASKPPNSTHDQSAAWPFSPIEPDRFYSLSEKGQVWALSQFQAAIAEAERLFGSQRGNTA